MREQKPKCPPSAMRLYIKAKEAGVQKKYMLGELLTDVFQVWIYPNLNQKDIREKLIITTILYSSKVSASRKKQVSIL